MLDEIITGVRINCSNIQNIYKLKSDISTFGKVAGGGMPIGIIGISNKIEKKLSIKNKKVFFGGTFSGNSLSMFVGNKTIEHLIKNKKKIFLKINSNSNYFVNNLNKQIYENKIKARVINFHSIVRIIFSEKIPKDRVQRDFFEKKRNSNRTKFIKFLKKNKIIFPNNGIMFISHAMEKKHLQLIIKKIIIGLKKNFKS
jgi:glutamate-1-semialdehyde 2,1-aminomutase